MSDPEERDDLDANVAATEAVRPGYRARLDRPVGMNLPQIQKEYAGLWVALKAGEVVQARATPYELVAALHERTIRDTTIIRLPGLCEPELVGLG